MTTQASSSTNGSAVRDELKHDADRLKGTIGERAKTEATTRIDQASQALGSASAAFDAAAEKLDSNSDAPDWMASVIQQAARKMDGLAERISGGDLDDIGREVTNFARHNPGAYLAASAAAGFAAARVLRAGMDKKSHEQADISGSEHVLADNGNSASFGADDAGSSALNGSYQQDIEGAAS